MGSIVIASNIIVPIVISGEASGKLVFDGADGGMHVAGVGIYVYVITEAG